MKPQLLLILSAAVLLSGCATMSPESTTPTFLIQQNLSLADQTELNAKLNTIKDGEPTVWHNSEGNTAFDLTTSNTYVDGHGLPCRSYTLIIDRDYHRKITTSAVACRDNGQWKNQ